MFGFTARLTAAAVLVGAAACASGGSSAATASPQGSTDRPARRNSNTLVADDFKGLESLNLGDALQRLKPEWLRRGAARDPGRIAPDQLAVWVDDNRLGGADVLSGLSVQGVMSVRYYSGPEAQARFGNGNSGGAIHITMTAGAKRP
jgi:hypothetical protein